MIVIIAAAAATTAAAADYHWNGKHLPICTIQ